MDANLFFVPSSFSCIQENIRVRLGPQGSYIQGKAISVDPQAKTVKVESFTRDLFDLEYDKLVIAVGVKTNTFGMESIKSAQERGDDIFFLKRLHHARAIRTNIIDSFEKASLPNVSVNEKKRLLSFVVVGGGPTSCEFTAELHDFVRYDVKRLYKDLLPLVRITIVEAGPALLGPFDKALQQYAQGLFKKREIEVRLGTAVIGVEDFVGDGYHFPAKRALLSNGQTIEFGTMVWSAGLAPRTFTQQLDESFQRHPRTKRVLVDEYLRVKGHEGSIWAVGDACVNETGLPIPQLAQVARQQGIYLARVLNGKQAEDEVPFKFFSFGSMAFMGELNAIYDGSSVGTLKDKTADPGHPPKTPVVKGFTAFLLWRFAYWGRQVSWVNKTLIPLYWFKSYFFGRDISRF
jgi:NADH dehydrogenase FAD-containing subunit